MLSVIHSNHSKRSLSGSVLGVVLTLLLGGVCPPSFAQDTEKGHGSKYPRPNLASEGQTIIRPNGLAVKFFESESDDSAERRYILYEPPIFLLTKTDGSGRRILDATVSEDGIATVNFFWDSAPEKTHEAIRAYLDQTPGYGSKYKSAIIKPLFVTVGWLESAQDTTVRSQEFPPQSFNTSGRIRAYFDFRVREEAQKFVDALNADDETLTPIQLNFRYSFSGDARDTCSADVSSEQIAETERFKSLTGAGGPGKVTRDQLTDIADDLFKSVSIRTTCRDLGAADRLVRQAVAQLGAPEHLTTWEQLGEFSGLSPSDFAADLTTQLEKSNKSVDRDQIRNAITEAESSQKSGKIAAGWGPFMGAVSASLSNASQLARSEFEDHLSKSSIAVQWDGQKYVPKSLNVHSREEIVRSWKGGVKVSYTKLSDGSQLHAITLTEKNWLNTITVTPEEGLDLRRALDRLNRRLSSLDTSLRVNDGLLSSHDTLLDAYGNRLDVFGNRLDVYGNYLESLHALLNAYGTNLKNLEGSMMVRTYEFRLYGTDDRNKRSDFLTGVSSREYPVAMVNNWSLESDCFPSYGPMNPQLLVNRNEASHPWLIAVRDADSDCDFLDVVVTFVKGPILGSSSRLGIRGRTKGGVLDLIER